MIDELLSRIENYGIRVREAYERLHADDYDYDDEDLEFDDEETEDLDLDEPFNSDEAANAGEDNICNLNREEITYGADEEIVWGHEKYKYGGYERYPNRYTVSQDNPFYFDIDGVVFSKETGLLISFPPGKAEEYTIPQDERITGIGDFAFAGNPLLKKIEFGENVQYIGRYALAMCDNLLEMSVPSSVQFLGDGAFSSCKKMKRVSLNCDLANIPYRLFINDDGLEYVRYSAKTRYISRGAFSGCSSLNDLKPCGEERMDYDVVLPESLKLICGEAFSNCIAIHSVFMPGVKIIEDSAFAGCLKLETVLVDSAEEYKAYCFRKCNNLRSFTFGNHTISLGKEIFTETENLKEIQFNCAPEFSCKPDSMPNNTEYVVDTDAYLSIAKPYICKPVFLACLLNIIQGRKASEQSVETAKKIIKRNRKRNYQWFLQDEQILTWIMDQQIIDCDDCISMLKIAEKDEHKTEIINGYMKQCYKVKKIASALEKWEKNDKEQREKELEQQRIIEEREKHLEEQQKRERQMDSEITVDQDVKLEEMGLSEETYNCLKNAGFNSIKDFSGMIFWDLIKIRDIHRRNFEELFDKLRYYVNGNESEQVKKAYMSEQENKSMDFDVSDLCDLDLDEPL